MLVAVPRFLYPFLVYRSILVPFLTLGAIVLPCWLIGRAFYIRRTGGRSRLAREVLLATFALYLSGVAAATLTPNGGEAARAEGAASIDLRPNPASLICSSPSLREGSTPHSFCVRNARGNVALFVPLGVLIPFIWSSLSFGGGVLIALSLSLGIETVQLVSRAFGSYRLADVNDVILNVAGACIGLALAALLRYFRDRTAAAPGQSR